MKYKCNVMVICELLTEGVICTVAVSPEHAVRSDLPIPLHVYCCPGAGQSGTSIHLDVTIKDVLWGPSSCTTELKSLQPKQEQL